MPLIIRFRKGEYTPHFPGGITGTSCLPTTAEHGGRAGLVPAWWGARTQERSGLQALYLLGAPTAQSHVLVEAPVPLIGVRG